MKTDYLLDESKFDRNQFPHMWNLSSAFLYDFVFIDKEYKTPEFVFIKNYYGHGISDKQISILNWNMTWESGHLRAEIFENELPAELRWLKKYKGENIYLIPEDKSDPYSTFNSMLHLLPLSTRKKFGLPLLKQGKWPFTLEWGRIPFEGIIKRDFEQKLSDGFAYHIWPLLDNQNKAFAFSKHDPIYVLSHNLKFWLPYLYEVIEDKLKCFGRIEPKSKSHLKKIDSARKQYPEIAIELPLMGGSIWYGEDEAWEVTIKMIEKANQQNKLNEIIDLVKSNRIVDDFSEKWSYAKEDFERRIYRKRNKVKVNFVEIEDYIPMHSAEAEIEGDMLWDDFISLLSSNEKRIVVCLRKGITKHKEISEELGYKGSSVISKKLSKIRIKAEKFLEL